MNVNTVLPARGSEKQPGRSRLRTIFLGSEGLRSGWRLLVFIGIFTLLQVGLRWVIQRFYHLPADVSWTPTLLILAELVSFILALVAVAAMARIEHGSFAVYGFPLKEAFGGLFWAGALWGILSISGVMLLMWLAGGCSVAGLALHGSELIRSAVLWALAFLMVGVYEELYFRSYPLFTLGRGIGFWAAAVVLSLIFGGLHYFVKPQETWIDGLSVTLVALFFCLTVRRTGNVWFAIGWHFTFNYGSMGIFGSPNTGNRGRPVAGHLLDSSFHGPAWLTGGPMGPEASVFIFVVLAVLFAVFHRRFREAKFLV